MLYHVIRAIKVWPVDYDWTPVFVLAMSGMCLLLASLCGVWLLKRLTEPNTGG